MRSMYNQLRDAAVAPGNLRRMLGVASAEPPPYRVDPGTIFTRASMARQLPQGMLSGFGDFRLGSFGALGINTSGGGGEIFPGISIADEYAYGAFFSHTSDHGPGDGAGKLFQNQLWDWMRPFGITWDGPDATVFQRAVENFVRLREAAKNAANTAAVAMFADVTSRTVNIVNRINADSRVHFREPSGSSTPEGFRARIELFGQLKAIVEEVSALSVPPPPPPVSVATNPGTAVTPPGTVVPTPSGGQTPVTSADQAVRATTSSSPMPIVLIGGALLLGGFIIITVVKRKKAA